MGNLRILLPDDQSEMTERVRGGRSDGIRYVEIGRSDRFHRRTQGTRLLKNCRQVRSSTGKTDR
jgi:hypothetical protein